MGQHATLSLREARPSDATRVRDIYAPHILQGAITFETEVPDLKDFEKRIEENLHYGFLVAEIAGVVVGYAYGSKHRERKAYQWCCEVSIYIDTQYLRLGVGKALYRELFVILKAKKLVNAYAGITLPNVASVGLHESLGFRHVGTYPKIGYKEGAWHDVGWWELSLNPHSNSPTVPLLGDK